MNAHALARHAALLVCLGLLLSVARGRLVSTTAMAQDTDSNTISRPSDEAGPQPFAGSDEAARQADEDLAAEPTRDPSGAATAAAPKEEAQINVLLLLFKGGYLMWPIVAMSLLVVTFGVERFLGLRRAKVIPPELVTGLGRLAAAPGGFDPRRAYQFCRQYPSTAATVIRAMLLKVGRPHAELENAVAEANQREAARLYTNVRWLSLAAGVAPLLGLLGTVWGMIMAFFATANLPIGANKAEALAEGIYTALVTTFAGLAVAIPAAVLAHLFEGRIQTLFRELDETLLGLMPQLERFEGRLRVTADQPDGPAYQRADAAAQPRPAAPTALTPELGAAGRPPKSDYPTPK